MEQGGSSRGLRVGIVGGGPDAREWATALAARSVEVVEAAALGPLFEERPGLILAFARAADLGRLADEIAAHPDGPPVTLFVVAEGGDHPQTRLLKALIAGKRDWETTFDAIVDPVALLASDGTVQRANLGLARLVDRPIRELIGRPYVGLLGLPAPASSDPIAESLRDGKPRTVEAGFENVPGVFQVTTSPLAGAEGAPTGLVVILKDVGELKEQQERLLQAARLADIGLLAAGVAHEINTPLASIALRAESLLKIAQDERLRVIDSFEKFPRYLRTIDEEIFRCKKIISALLEFSRSRKPEVRETDLNVLAERATDLVGHQMKIKQVGLTVRLDPALPRIQADDGQLRQALIALLMNALDATSAGGHVTVETRKEADGRVSLAVEDDGAGIPKEHLDKIFSPFFTTKPLGQGTGLGLAICHGIVASHGGAILVESQLGKGTRMALVLPVTARPAPRPEAGGLRPV